jgi:uncharacterized membrane protein
MLNQFETATKTTISLLKLLNVKVNNSTVNETLNNHPDWPSLLCISDSLKKWNIPNAAGKVDLNSIDEIPTPFIAHTPNLDNPLAIVKNILETEIILHSAESNKSTQISKTDFLKEWDGIFLIAEPNEISKEVEYKRNKIMNLIAKLIYGGVIFTLLIFTYFLLTRSLLNSQFKIFISIQFILMLIGVVDAILLLWYEIDKRNPFLQKVCTGIAKGNCNAILTSSKARIFDWLSWSEIGFFYFLGGFLTILSLAFSGAGIFILSWLNLLSLPYIIFSIYYQWRVAKQWCLLCLVVQLLLLSGGVNVFLNGTYYNFPDFALTELFKSLLIYIFPIVVWYSLKPYILKLQEIKIIKSQYLRLKYNKYVFKSMLSNQKSIVLNEANLGVNIGNTFGANRLVKVCNLYCGPCSEMHPKIDEIISKDKSISVQIIFKSPKYLGEENRKTVAHIMALYKLSELKKFKIILTEWYEQKEKKYEFLAQKHPLSVELIQEQYVFVDEMENWAKSMSIYATPTLFLNNHQIKSPYTIEDIQYFLLE